MSRSFCLLVVASLALVGCDLVNKQETQYDDSRNPYYKQAQQDLDNNNPAAAVNDYEAALAASPKLAGAHYELGLIYGDKLNDPIGSVFHFKRFLELDPSSDKADQVKALIDKQSQAFAASLPNSPTQSADDYAKLQADNASLKKQIDDATHTITQLQTQLAHEGKHHAGMMATAPAPVTAPAPAPVPPPPASDTASPAVSATPVGGTTPPAPTVAGQAAAPTTPPRALPVDLNAPNQPATDTTALSGPSRSYKIVSGDSLWKISHKMYPGDTKNGIDKIKDANKDVLIEGKPLRVGQVLVIPQ